MKFVELTCDKCGKREEVPDYQAKEILEKKKEDPKKEWICKDCYIQIVQKIAIFQPPIEQMGLEPDDFTI